MSKKGKGFLTGLLVGAGLGVLFSPKKGEEVRKDLLNKLEDLKEKTKDLDIEETRDNLTAKLDDFISEVQDLDKDKIEKLTKKQVNELKLKADNLYVYAKEKGTPILEEASKEIRKQTINLLESTLEKVKEKEA